MKLANAIITSALLTAMAAPVALAADGFSAAQTENIQKIVHDYLVQHPQVLLEASAVLQKQQQEEMQTAAKSTIMQHASELLDGGMTVVGNPNGHVTLVEFFDYQCGHCKQMSPIVHELIKSNPDLRVVYKEFPIFGKSSEFASKAALAAAKQGKYTHMQNALFAIKEHYDEKVVLETAKSLGLNATQLKKDMDSPEMSNILKQNRQLAEQMKLMGTPAFIVIATSNGKIKPGTEPALIPGGASLDTLKELIKKTQG